jgi:hypothetical protein
MKPSDSSKVCARALYIKCQDIELSNWISRWFPVPYRDLSVNSRVMVLSVSSRLMALSVSSSLLTLRYVQKVCRLSIRRLNWISRWFPVTLRDLYASSRVMVLSVSSRLTVLSVSSRLTVLSVSSRLTVLSVSSRLMVLSVSSRLMALFVSSSLLTLRYVQRVI